MNHSQMVQTRRKKQATRKRLDREAREAKKLTKQNVKAGGSNAAQKGQV